VRYVINQTSHKLPPFSKHKSTTMKAIEAFRDLPTTKEQVTSFSELIIRQLNDGEIEPLKFKIFLKCLEQVMDNIKPVLDEMARDEAEHYGEKEFNLMGAKVRLSEVGTRYDYSNCGYSKLNYVTTEMKDWEEQKKQCELFLRMLPNPATVVNELTGEIETIQPPVKISKSSITITL